MRARCRARRSGTGCEMATPCPGIGSERNHGRQSVASSVNEASACSIVARPACACSHASPLGERPPRNVFEGHVIRRDHAGTRPAFDRHIANGHPLLHVRARMAHPYIRRRARPAADPDPRDKRQDDVLRGHPPLSVPSTRTSMSSAVAEAGTESQGHVPPRFVPMPKARAPNAPCVDGVAVAADDRHPRLCKPEFRPDDVDDAAVATPCRTARRTRPVGLPSRLICLAASLSAMGSDWSSESMVHRRHRPVGPAHLSPRPRTRRTPAATSLHGRGEDRSPGRSARRARRRRHGRPDLLHEGARRSGRHARERTRGAPSGLVGGPVSAIGTAAA